MPSSLSDDRLSPALQAVGFPGLPRRVEWIDLTVVWAAPEAWPDERSRCGAAGPREGPGLRGPLGFDAVDRVDAHR